MKLQSVTFTALLVISFSSLIHAETYYFHNDHLGTSQALTDKDQNVVWQAEYDPFGKATETVTTIEQNLRFPGQYFDRETGLHYNYFRSYDPAAGRYTQSDPIGLGGGINTYGYSNQNPLSFFDSFGLSWVRILPRNMQGPVRGLPRSVQEQWRNTPQATKSGGNKHKNKPSDNVPTWARGERPKNGENGSSFAERLCDVKFGRGNYDTGPKSPFNQIKKWGDRDFQRTPLPLTNQVLPVPHEPWFMYDPSGPMYSPNYYHPSEI